MKKIINNKRYDTEKADRVGMQGSTQVYKKKTGELFGYNAKTEMITPFTNAEALKWLSENALPEGEQRAQVNAWVSEDLKARYDALKKAQGVTVADVFAAGVEALEKGGAA
jgi:hypothetical protein